MTISEKEVEAALAEFYYPGMGCEEAIWSCEMMDNMRRALEAAQRVREEARG